MFIVPDPSRFRGRVVDTGSCVRFVQVAGGLPHTTRWKRGRRVRNSGAVPGTAIATFSHAPPYRYTNHTNGSSHAAVLIRQQSDGLLVWDQWKGRPVNTRVIQFRGGKGKAVNDGCRFYVIIV